jgi:hypothetical protein
MQIRTIFINGDPIILNTQLIRLIRGKTVQVGPNTEELTEIVYTEDHSVTIPVQILDFIREFIEKPHAITIYFEVPTTL